jgi:beta-galactosidase
MKPSSSNFKFGTAYYPEHIPPVSLMRTLTGEIKSFPRSEAIKEDFKWMHHLGIKLIRMGEFAWSHVAPEEGVFQPDLFLETLDLAHTYGIQVLMSTPTATPPKWLIDKYPDILPFTRGGSQIPFGSRRHYDPAHPQFLEECKTIVKQFARSFAKHPSVIGWQIDNEFGCHDSVYLFSKHIQSQFAQYLKKRYHDNIEEMCSDLFLDFWSQRITQFDQIHLPYQSWADQNPGLELRFREFSQSLFHDFTQSHIDMIRKERPDTLFTHNFMTSFFDLDPWGLAPLLDVAGFDHYQMTPQPHPIRSCWQMALQYSLKNKPYWVLEQQPVQVNWQSVNRRFSLDWLYVWGFLSYFTGASLLCYFSWRKMWGGAEQYHDGILHHDLRMPYSPTAKTLLSTQNSLQLLFHSQMWKTDPKPLPRALIWFDFESKWAADICSQSVLYQVQEGVDKVASWCTQRALGMHFFKEWLPRFWEEPFEVLLIPGHLFELSPAQRDILKRWLQMGRLIVTFPRFGTQKPNHQMSPFPVTLLDPNDFYLEESGALLETEVEPFSFGRRKMPGAIWAEKIILQNKQWKVMSKFVGGLYQGFPAALLYQEKASIHQKSSGSWLHFATWPKNPSDLHRTLDTWLPLATPLRSKSPSVCLLPLEASTGRVYAAINLSPKTEEITLSKNNWEATLLSQEAQSIPKFRVVKSKGGKFPLPPFHVALLKTLPLPSKGILKPKKIRRKKPLRKS